MINVYTKSLEGHRSAYLSFIGSIFPVRHAELKKMIFKSQPLFFLMIEESFFLYCVVCLFRSLLGFKTAGLLFRPKPVVEGAGLRLIIKRCVLTLFKKIPTVKTLLILPVELHGKFEEIADGWIYDFQCWDLDEENYKQVNDLKDRRANNALIDKIRSISDGKKVVCAMGTQDRIKGYDVFAKCYSNIKAIREKYAFVFGGKVRGYENITLQFMNAGGVAENRFVSDDELIMLYAASDIVWALYAEDYDQASGVFGRAVQLGIPVLIRKGSLIHKICQRESIVHIALNSNELASLVTMRLPPVDMAKGKQLRDRFKSTSIDVLSDFLGVKPLVCQSDR